MADLGIPPKGVAMPCRPMPFQYATPCLPNAMPPHAFPMPCCPNAMPPHATPAPCCPSPMPPQCNAALCHPIPPNGMPPHCYKHSYLGYLFPFPVSVTFCSPAFPLSPVPMILYLSIPIIIKPSLLKYASCTSRPHSLPVLSTIS